MLSLFRTDSTIKRDVEHEIKYDPSIEATDQIAVMVDDGVVTLIGTTANYIDCYNAEKAAKRITGVKAVVNEIRILLSNERADLDVARDALAILARELPAAARSIKASVRDGQITLEGQVEWNYQKERAERVLRGIPGVKSIKNLIVVVPKVQPVEVKKKIEEALLRSARMDAQAITVEAEGGSVTLRGTVHSMAEREQAERSAWSAAGVSSVRNNIRVVP